MNTLVFFLLSLATAIDIDFYSDDPSALLSHWLLFRYTFEKKFANSSFEDAHIKVFYDNTDAVVAFNANSSETYRKGVNQFTDMTSAEFMSILPPIPLAVIESEANKAIPILTDFLDGSNASLPTAYNCGPQTGPVHNQFSCASGYAFSAISVVQGAARRKYKHNLDLSEQQAVNCWAAKNGEGCDGGWAPDVFRGIKMVGSTRDKLLRYTANPGRCMTSPAYAWIKTIFQVHSDADSIKRALIQYGALSVAVDAAEWSSYQNGIFHTDSVSAVPNHVVTLVGWGRDAVSGLDYWLVKNSWGSLWGNAGYIKVEASSPNAAQMLKYAYGVTA